MTQSEQFCTNYHFITLNTLNNEYFVAKRQSNNRQRPLKAVFKNCSQNLPNIFSLQVFAERQMMLR